jgi:hypothetical protein
MKNSLLNKQENAMNALKDFTRTTRLKMPTLKPTTTTVLGGSFNKYQIDRFWTSFNHDLYNRICEIKMQEI